MLLSLLPEYNILYESGKLNSNAVNIISSNEELLRLLYKETEFLPVESTLRERLYCIVHEITSPVLCQICDTPLKIKKSGRLEYPIYCSRKCRNNDINTIQQKIQQTTLEKYGYKSVLSVPEIRAKQDKTKIEKYGVDNVFKLQEYQQKAKNTIKEKYGVDNVMYDENIKATQKKRCSEKEFDSINEKIRKTTFTNNGYYNIRQQHLDNMQLSLLNDAPWLNNNHHNDKLTLVEIADIIGVEPTIVGLKFKAFELPVQRFSQSIGEKQVLQFIQTMAIEPFQGDRGVLNGKELDIYLPEYNIAIEYNGLYWHSEQKGKDKHYHKQKYDLCKEKGIQLITIFEDEWQQKQEQVKLKLLSLFNKDNREIVFARKTNIILVDNADKVTFFDNNHIQGNGPGSINIGLEYDGTLVACMSFIKQKKHHYLNRYATSCRVPGGFSKLLKYFQNNYEWQQLISFADLRWSNGNLYNKTGWTLDSVLPPDYSYSPDGKNRFHKFGYRRQFLPNKLKQFNPDLSERENCDNNGILRIWDCGKLRYIINNNG